jgi:PAS domain S-box-containing protein
MNYADMTREELVRKITELETARQELDTMRETVRTQDEQYKNAIEYTGTAMLVLEEDGTISAGNHKTEIITGYSKAEFTDHKPFTVYVAPEDRPRMLSYFKRRREDASGAPGAPSAPTEYEFKLLQKNGGVRNMLINVSMIPDTKKSLVSLMDITDRARAEADLRQSEKRFKDIAMLLPATICEWDGSLRLRYANPKGLEMFQLTKEDVDRGLNLYDMIPPQERTKAEKDIANVFQGDFGNAVEYCVTRKDGKQLHILVNSAPIMPERGLRMCIVDITDRVEAQQKLREMEKQAEEARINLARQETEKVRNEVVNLRREILERAAFADMVSRSPLMKEIFDILPEVAVTPATVLVTGESGTGKELVARSLHELSDRKTKPFVAINCSALPDTLLESELFGYKAGAFTDAKKDKPGTFSRAHGGTIFLDEIGDISPAMQVKLLRVIQEKTFEPLGATEPVKVDVRIVAATNKDLGEQVKKGLFREDLYYRINVLVIKLPPLRDRRCDIPVLCDHFINRFNSRYNKEIKGISPEAESMLLAYDFPGNIRELENIIERAFIFCKDPFIAVTHLPQHLSAPNGCAAATSLSHVKDFDELEKLYLISVLEETGGSKIKAAERLGIHKATLFRKLRKLGIEKSSLSEE